MPTNNATHLLKVKRWKQHCNECAISVVATLANYYDPQFTYRNVRRFISTESRHNGLYTPEQGILLNELGFSNITIVTYNLDIFDYAWNRYTKKGFISRLKKVKCYYQKNEDDISARMSDYYLKFLMKKDCSNSVIIDNDLASHIKKNIKNNRPIGIRINWTSMYKKSKGSISTGGDIKNNASYHAIVARGFDDNYVYVSDPDSYKTKSGFYRLKWSIFLTIADELLIIN